MAKVGLPSFFLQTEQYGGEEILLKLAGGVALLLVESDEEKWKKHVVQENGKCTVYVLCNKAIYGTMNAALLAYRKLAKLFKSWGLIMSPNDPCVWNKDVNGEQLTIMLHIDDLLLAHLEASIITEFNRKLDREYATHKPLTVTRGLTHEYLGQSLDFSFKGQCAMSQYDFVKKI